MRLHILLLIILLPGYAAAVRAQEPPGNSTGLYNVDELEQLANLTESSFITYVLNNGFKVYDTSGIHKTFAFIKLNTDGSQNRISRYMAAKNVIINITTTSAAYYSGFQQSLLRMAYVPFKTQSSKATGDVPATVYYYVHKPYIAFIQQPVDHNSTIGYNISLSKVLAW